MSLFSSFHRRLVKPFKYITAESLISGPLTNPAPLLASAAVAVASDRCLSLHPCPGHTVASGTLEKMGLILLSTHRSPTTTQEETQSFGDCRLRGTCLLPLLLPCLNTAPASSTSLPSALQSSHEHALHLFGWSGLSPTLECRFKDGKVLAVPWFVPSQQYRVAPTRCSEIFVECLISDLFNFR